MPRLKRYISGYRRPRLTKLRDTKQIAALRGMVYQAWLIGKELPHVGSHAYSGDGWDTWLAENMTPDAKARLSRQIDIVRRT